MLKTNRVAFGVSSLFVVLSVGCAHPQTVTLTSAAALAPPAPAAAPVASAPAEESAEADEDGEPAQSAARSTPDKTPAAEAKATPKKSDGPMSFEELSAALGDGQKMGLNVESSTPAPVAKGLSSEGYSAVGAAHQAVDSGSGARAAGDIKVSGGLTAAAVRSGVHGAAARLRACYEHGLAANPRLAGRVMVSFSVDGHGAVSGVEAESDVIPADVRSCVQDAFSSMTFAPPKTAPAKIVYPIDFNKDS